MRISGHLASKAFLSVACLLLAGCPLFGDRGESAKGSSNNPAFRVTLAGEGVEATSDYAYRIALPPGVESVPLQLVATLDGKPVRLSSIPVSNAPDRVRVDAVDRLAALREGRAQVVVMQANNRAELALEITEQKSDGPAARVLGYQMHDERGQVQSFVTDNYKYGNGGIWREPNIHVEIVEPSGKRVTGFRCRNFAVVPRQHTVPNHQPPDEVLSQGPVVKWGDEFRGGIGVTNGKAGCDFGVSGSGFPIIGSGDQEFEADVLWVCSDRMLLPECGTPGYPPCKQTNRACGKPIAGGPIKFKVKRQSVDFCDYCEGR